MAEEKMIEATAGPYAGQRISIPAGDADQAITDGWARDPFATPDPKAKPKEWDMEKVGAAAEKAARKLRGEDIGKDKKPAAKAASAADRSMSSGSGEGDYLDRASTAKTAAPKK